MQLSIVIVNWNVRDLLCRLVDSILHFTNELEYEIIIVDNDSTDGSIKKLKKNYQKQLQSGKLTLIENNFNAGFAKANNQGLKIAKGKYVLFMNPDMEMVENSFLKLYKFMEKTPNVGVSTCRLVYGDKTIQPNVKNNPTFCSQIFVILKLHHFFSWVPCLKKYLAKDFDYTQKKYVQQVMGAFVFMKRELANKLGGWDETFWLWWEDLDLCKRVQEKGAEIVYLPITEVIHYEGKSFAQTYGLVKQKRFNKALLTYFKHHHSKLAYFIFYILQPLNLLLTIIIQMLKIKPRSQSKLSK